MLETNIFDGIKRLIDTNLIEEQATAIIKEIHSSHQNNNVKLATKEHLEKKLDEVTLVIKFKLERLRAELFKWFIGAFVMQTTTLISTLVISLMIV